MLFYYVNLLLVGTCLEFGFVVVLLVFVSFVFDDVLVDVFEVVEVFDLFVLLIFIINL